MVKLYISTVIFVFLIGNIKYLHGKIVYLNGKIVYLYSRIVCLNSKIVYLSCINCPSLKFFVKDSFVMLLLSVIHRLSKHFVMNSS